MEDVALQNLAIVFVIDRAGIVGEDGVTHQGISDLAYLRTIPNLVMMAPKDGRELEAMLEFAIGLDKPVAIRYPKEKIQNSKFKIQNKIQLGKAEVLKEGKDFVLIALGSRVAPSAEAAELLEKEKLSATLVNARFVKPLDSELFRALATKTKFIFTVEEGIIAGGFGSAVAEAIDNPVIRIGLPCEFIPHGKREIILERYGLSAEGISRKIKSIIWQK
jgi:1-deoxy-D-xylulose-5-phosphate synthase